MRKFSFKLKTFLISTLSALAVVFCAISFMPTIYSAKADGKIDASVFQTDGASVRVFETLRDDNGNLIFNETTRTGIRFHVEMGDGYLYGGQKVIDTTVTNERNGSFKLADGFKTYTLILPTRLLDGDLTFSTGKALKIDTSEYWFKDSDGNLESVAYVWDIPAHRLTDNFSYRGVLCTVAQDGTETVVAQTNLAERCIAEVSKLARQTALDEAEEGNYRWGEDKHAKSLEILQGFIPTYNITYKVNGQETYETVFWGDEPQHVPTEGAKGAWYDKEAHEEVDLSGTLDFAESRTLVLETTSSDEFVLTGVAAYTNNNGKSGVKIYATLHSDKFSYNQELDIHAINVEYEGSGTFDGITGVWTMEDEEAGGQMRLFFAFDSSKMVSGDKIIIKGDSIFYANGVMYKLTEDYTIDYDGISYGMFLGYLNNSHIKSIYNAPEDTNEDDVDDEFTIRVEFHEDIMITDAFKFVNDSSTTPVYVERKNGDKIKIIGGEYYWNNGAFKILELIAENDTTKGTSAYGIESGDKLKVLAGTKLVQNGGYYVFEDEMYAEFVKSNAPEYERTGGYWTIGTQKAAFGISEFATTGENVIDAHGNKEMRINTATHWFTTTPTLSIENMSSAPYGAYFTKADGTKIEITEFVYHGQDNGNGGNYQILGIRGNIGENAGDMITIIAGTRFWSGNVYYTISEEVHFYFNGTYWVTNFDKTSFGELDASSFNGRIHHHDGTQIRMYFTSPLAGLTDDPDTSNTWQIGKGSITMNGIPYTSLTYHYWDANSVFLIINQGTASVSPVGIDLFHDTLVIEEGTTLWSGAVAYQFTERLEFRYIGYEPEGNMPQAWVLVRENNVNVAKANISELTNEPNEIRLWLNGNGKVLNTDYSGEMLIDTRNPVLFNGNVVTKGLYHSQTYNMVSLYGVSGANDGDYFKIPAGSVWWTPQNGTVTFTEELFYTFVNRNWVNGDHRATASVTANNASVSGVEHMAKGQTYTATITANSGYVISKVTINGKEQALNANHKYEFTAQTENEILVETIVGYNVTFNVGEGATVTANGKTVANGGIIAVASGTNVSFTVNVAEGYRLTDVSGATGSGNTYSVIANEHKTITITTEKLYKVTFSASNATATIKANGVAIDSGEWVENGTEIEFTVTANSGYTVMSVSGATKTDSNTFITTVSGNDVNAVATTVATDSLTVVNNTIGIENRTNWNPSANPDHLYFALTYTGGTNSWLNVPDGDLKGYWNDHPEKANSNMGVDIMEYILINGETVRDITLANKAGQTNYKGTTEPFNHGSWYAPITIEPTVGSGLFFKVLNSYASDLGGTFEVTIKSGFTIEALLANGSTQRIIVTKDIVYDFDGSTFRKVIDAEPIDVTGTITITRDDWMSGNATDCTTFSIRVKNDNGEGYRYEYLVADSSIQGYWNNNGATYTIANGGVDVMEYLYFNGESARSLVNKNKNGQTSFSGTTFPLSAAGEYAPIAIETNGSFAKMMVLNSWMPDGGFTVTIKSGFELLLNDGKIIYITEDVSFKYANGTITKPKTETETET